jgi:hypothetical protein
MRNGIHLRPPGPCWCAEESVRLPMPPLDGEDCLCRDCLRKAAGDASESSHASE